MKSSYLFFLAEQYFEFDAPLASCSTQDGQQGTCRLPVSCIGVTLQFMEANTCTLAGGELGACCPPVPISNITDILYEPKKTVHIPPSIATKFVLAPKGKLTLLLRGGGTLCPPCGFLCFTLIGGI